MPGSVEAAHVCARRPVSAPTSTSPGSGELVQNLKRWQARPPKLPEAPTIDVSETPQSDAPPFASDGRDLGEATTPTEPAFEPKAGAA